MSFAPVFAQTSVDLAIAFRFEILNSWKSKRLHFLLSSTILKVAKTALFIALNSIQIRIPRPKHRSWIKFNSSDSMTDEIWQVECDRQFLSCHSRLLSSNLKPEQSIYIYLLDCGSKDISWGSKDTLIHSRFWIISRAPWPPNRWQSCLLPIDSLYSFFLGCWLWFRRFPHAFLPPLRIRISNMHANLEVWFRNPIGNGVGMVLPMKSALVRPQWSSWCPLKQPQLETAKRYKNSFQNTATRTLSLTKRHSNRCPPLRKCW